MLFDLFIFILILSILVLIHEAGHFFVAKLFGIKVEEFGYGIPPRAWGKKIGETIYSVNWLPIGGFVKLFGEDEAGGGRITGEEKHPSTSLRRESVRGKDLSRAFFAKPVWQRALVVVAGVVMNVLLAAVIYYVFIFMSGFRTELPLLSDHKFFLVNQQDKSEVIISDVVKDSPAAKAGIDPMTKVVAINGHEVGAENFASIIKQYQGQEITLAWQDVRTNKQSQAKLTPRKNPPKNQGALGISFYPIRTAILNYQTPMQKVLSGFSHPFNLMVYNVDVMAKLVSVSIQQKSAAPISEGISGPVGIFSIVSSIAQIPDFKAKVLQMLNLAGILSISLAFFNVLPIPALDGGRLFFILIEGVIGRKVNPKIEGYIHQVGMAILIMLILLITFKDIGQLFR